MLVGIGTGSLIGGVLDRRTHAPAQMFILTQAALVVATLLGMRAISAASIADTSTTSDLWFNLRPILVEAGLPALLMGCSFPLANAMIQHAEQTVGRRAGLLYFANTGGAVAGSLATGFVLLPAVGMQNTATTLAIIAAGSIAPIGLALVAEARRLTAATTVAALAAAAAIALWTTLPRDYLLQRALLPQLPGERTVSIREAVGEVIPSLRPPASDAAC